MPPRSRCGTESSKTGSVALGPLQACFVSGQGKLDCWGRLCLATTARRSTCYLSTDGRLHCVDGKTLDVQNEFVSVVVGEICGVLTDDDSVHCGAVGRRLSARLVGLGVSRVPVVGRFDKLLSECGFTCGLAGENLECWKRDTEQRVAHRNVRDFAFYLGNPYVVETNGHAHCIGSDEVLGNNAVALSTSSSGYCLLKTDDSVECNEPELSWTSARRWSDVSGTCFRSHDGTEQCVGKHHLAEPYDPDFSVCRDDAIGTWGCREQPPPQGLRSVVYGQGFA